ncbi:putative protease [Ectothiorhodosinus mongolicus]|uniref:Putative protease n=1 Tax=Ectothiorhodosinus mongolicus TaxID=233100 RepID=A0A1R3VYR3_9GAMM|nr:tRNA 5-hydroxyuridine modification protein YegQ [Ectothiorhodosinus mongolicus]ULX57197.1 U32 family peptidase [Ectothiorhodosinus mongolicus]SIT70371.1 putative protease [Ectothiorhodosinus mongolicus]
MSTPHAPGPELLAPAGTLQHVEHALAYGADAVYAGMPRYSLRVRNNSFSGVDTLRTGIDMAHAAGGRFYLAANITAHQAKVHTFLRDITPVIELQPDALIMADPGLIMLVREKWPEMRVHLSVQASTVNAAAVRFWQHMGLKRVILSRELSLNEIEQIRQECPDMELEVFVHGAMCIAYSGRCLLSGFFNHRDANQGTCTNACRWQYQLQPAASDATGDLVPMRTERHPQANQPFLLEESERPGQWMPMEEDEHGTYILNATDLRAIEHVHRLTAIGVDSVKIEGRTKSPYYVSRAARAYRAALNDAAAGRPFNPELLTDLEGLANRGYTDGFLVRNRDRTETYERGHSESDYRLLVGAIRSYNPDTGEADIEVKNRFSLEDTLEVMTPSGNLKLRGFVMHNFDGESVSVAPGSGHWVRLALPPGDYRHAFVLRCLDKESAL